MMKPNEVRNLNRDEIATEVKKSREELLDLRFQAAMGQASDTRRIRTVKRHIARLLTIDTEKQNAENAEQRNAGEA